MDIYKSHLVGMAVKQYKFAKEVSTKFKILSYSNFDQDNAHVSRWNMWVYWHMHSNIYSSISLPVDKERFLYHYHNLDIIYVFFILFYRFDSSIFFEFHQLYICLKTLDNENASQKIIIIIIKKEGKKKKLYYYITHRCNLKINLVSSLISILYVLIYHCWWVINKYILCDTTCSFFIFRVKIQMYTIYYSIVQLIKNYKQWLLKAEHRRFLIFSQVWAFVPLKKKKITSHERDGLSPKQQRNFV